MTQLHFNIDLEELTEAVLHRRCYPHVISSISLSVAIQHGTIYSLA